jgi:hypothetical protein
MGLKFHLFGEQAEILNEISIPGGFTAGRSYRVFVEIQAPIQFFGVRIIKMLLIVNNIYCPYRNLVRWRYGFET